MILEKIKEKLANKVINTHSHVGDDTATIQKDSIVEAIQFLKEDADLDFNMLSDLSALDCLKLEDKAHRFEVVYHFYSLKHKHRVRLKVTAEEGESVPTVTGEYKNANWLEREVFDMFGITFQGHPDLRRILMYEEFEGHPLRKDYPVDKRQPLVRPTN